MDNQFRLQITLASERPYKIFKNIIILNITWKRGKKSLMKLNQGKVCKENRGVFMHE